MPTDVEEAAACACKAFKFDSRDDSLVAQVTAVEINEHDVKSKMYLPKGKWLSVSEIAVQEDHLIVTVPFQELQILRFPVPGLLIPDSAGPGAGSSELFYFRSA